MTITSSISAVRVKGVMSTHPLTVTPDMEIVKTLREMIRTDHWYVPVVKSSQDQSYVGVLGLERFILKALEKEVARLNLPLTEVMSTQLFTCSQDDEIDNVWQKMKKRSFAACPVVEKGRPVGMVTQQDLLQSGSLLPTFETQKGRFKSPTKISVVMKTSPAALKPTDTLKDAAILLLERNIGRVLIVDDRHELVGIVDREDIVKALIRT